MKCYKKPKTIYDKKVGHFKNLLNFSGRRYLHEDKEKHSNFKVYVFGTTSILDLIITITAFSNLC